MKNGSQHAMKQMRTIAKVLVMRASAELICFLLFSARFGAGYFIKFSFSFVGALFENEK